HSRSGGSLAYYARVVAILLLLVAGAVSTTLARSWSYHYKPIAAKPSATPTTEANIALAKPASGEQLSPARLLKRAIVSNLALFVLQQNSYSEKAYADHSAYVTSRLSHFDSLTSPEALAVFASLSGYNLGARAQQLYECLSLRKGKALEPYFEQYLHNGSNECVHELGASMTQPNAALGNHPLCPSDEQQKIRLTTLLSAIESAKTCSDSELAAAATHPGASALNP
ncbi:MAG TPA: hypothetical protein VMB26_14965, partial [Candidatus Binataceae bacterium]|nr:hypothetical protein [Candidatus Binataceae bacterium]